MRKFVSILAAVTALPALADEADSPAKGIQDNSFLIEEAYNQEAGVVQHILNGRRQGRDWLLSLTQEFPLGSQDHQLSYTLPYSFLRTEDGSVRGFGDVLLNYRYQVWTETDWRPAFAPRISAIFPSGNREKGLGTGSGGIQVNLPFSKVISDRVSLHANAGMTSLFSVYGRSPTSFAAGGSVIYAVNKDFNLMLEAIGNRDESVDQATRAMVRKTSLTISPGFRMAANFPGAQVVWGLAAPVTLSKAKPDFGAFLYFSVEHEIFKGARK